jgi:hypothetical protein
MDLAAWTTDAVRHIRHELRGDAQWKTVLAPTPRAARIHLAVFVEPFLSYVLDGSKSVESRFSTKQCAPFRRVEPGDIILLKAASGPVRGICAVAKTWFFDLRSVPLSTVRERYAESICATDDGFWQSREKADFATLMKLRWVRELPPMTCPKRDRRGWVILDGDRDQLALPYSS